MKRVTNADLRIAFQMAACFVADEYETCCGAISAVCEFNPALEHKAAGLLGEYYRPEGLGFGHLWWTADVDGDGNWRECQNQRVLALLFMAAMCKRGAKL